MWLIVEIIFSQLNSSLETSQSQETQTNRIRDVISKESIKSFKLHEENEELNRSRRNQRMEGGEKRGWRLEKKKQKVEEEEKEDVNEEEKKRRK